MKKLIFSIFLIPSIAYSSVVINPTHTFPSGITVSSISANYIDIAPYNKTVYTIGNSGDVFGTPSYGTGLYIADGDVLDVLVYAYKTVDGIRIYSPVGQGTGVGVTVDSSSRYYQILWGWDLVADAEGYRLLKFDALQGWAYDHYRDISGGGTNTFIDQYYTDWTVGSTVLPNSWTTGNVGLNVEYGSSTFGGVIVSTVPDGKAPFSINSTTLNSNLNADFLDGYHGSYFAPATDYPHTGITVDTITITGGGFSIYQSSPGAVNYLTGYTRHVSSMTLSGDRKMAMATPQNRSAVVYVSTNSQWEPGPTQVIGDPVSRGTNNSVLYVGPTGLVSNDSTFKYIASTLSVNSVVGTNVITSTALAQFSAAMGGGTGYHAGDVIQYWSYPYLVKNGARIYASTANYATATDDGETGDLVTLSYGIFNSSGATVLRSLNGSGATVYMEVYGTRTDNNTGWTAGNPVSWTVGYSSFSRMNMDTYYGLWTTGNVQASQINASTITASYIGVGTTPSYPLQVVGTSALQTLYSSHHTANSNKTYDLGATGTYWRAIYVSTVAASSISVTGYINTGSGIQFSDNSSLTSTNTILSTQVAASTYYSKASSKGYIYFPVQSAKLPTSNPARIDAGDQNWRLLFDASTIQSANWQFVMPYDYGSSTAPVVYLKYSMNSTQSGVTAVIWRAAIMADSDGDAEDIGTSGFDTANESTTTHPSGLTAGYLQTSTVTLTTNDSLAAGDFVQLKIDRFASAGGDSGTGDAELVGIIFEYQKQ